MAVLHLFKNRLIKTRILLMSRLCRNPNSHPLPKCYSKLSSLVFDVVPEHSGNLDLTPHYDTNVLHPSGIHVGFMRIHSSRKTVGPWEFSSL